MTNNTTRPPDGTPSNLTADFSKAVTALEVAVFDLIASGWEEDPRRRAYEMTVALRQAAHAATWKDTESELRALESLLALSPQVVQSIQRPIGDKVLQFVGMLRGAHAARARA